MKNDLTLREVIMKCFGVALPISGGRGSSKEDAIKIDVPRGGDGVSVEYAVLAYIHMLGDVRWELDTQYLIKENGKVYDKLKLWVEDDPKNWHSYYFDITSFFGRRGDDSADKK